MTTTTGLRRELGLRDAIVVGLGAMLGAGVFGAVGPAAAAVGPSAPGLLAALAEKPSLESTDPHRSDR